MFNSYLYEWKFAENSLVDPSMKTKLNSNETGMKKNPGKIALNFNLHFWCFNFGLKLF